MTRDTVTPGFATLRAQLAPTLRLSRRAQLRLYDLRSIVAPLRVVRTRPPMDRQARGAD